jgi:hypothetical protein
MNDYKKYHKYDHYICEIELFDKSKTDNISEKINILNASYKTDICKINKIINIIDKTEIEKIDNIYYKNAIIEKNRICNLYDVIVELPDILYFLSYDNCFYHNFIEEKQYLLWKNGFCGTYDVYDYSGIFIKTKLINNDKIIDLDS